MTRKQELLDLFLIAGGDRGRVQRLVDDIAGGKLTLPACFNIKGGTKEQTERAHTIAREMRAN